MILNKQVKETLSLMCADSRQPCASNGSDRVGCTRDLSRFFWKRGADSGPQRPSISLSPPSAMGFQTRNLVFGQTIILPKKRSFKTLTTSARHCVHHYGGCQGFRCDTKMGVTARTSSMERREPAAGKAVRGTEAARAGLRRRNACCACAHTCMQAHACVSA